MFLTKRRSKATPLPEAIDGEAWQIREVEKRQAGVSTEKHFMQVPLGDDPVDRLIRLHEMVHVKITPDEIDELEGLPEDVVQLCEDSRVHGHLQRMGFDTKPLKDVISEHEMKHMGEESHPAQLAALAAAMYRTGELDRLLAAIPSHDHGRKKIAEYGWQLASNRTHGTMTLPTFDVVVQMAQEIVNLLGNPDDPPPPPPQSPPPPSATSPPSTPLPVHENWLPKLAEKRKTAAPTKEERQSGVIAPSTAMWASMTFETPPLPLRMPAKMRGRRRKLPEVRGRRLHRVGRLHQDGRVFADKPPVKGGGAVLIDTSGSMKLSIEEVLMLMHKYPAGIIGSYSSIREGERNEHGTLRVIAKNGRRVTDELVSTPGTGNGVDGPALEWLAKQPGPRFWISDAGVSGGVEGLHYCLDLCRRARITRVDNAWQLVGKHPS